MAAEVDGALVSRDQPDRPDVGGGKVELSPAMCTFKVTPDSATR